MTLVPAPISDGSLARSADPVDPDQVLSDRARARILDGMPANTQRAYRRQWTEWVAWCESQGRRSLPATPETLAEYVTHLIDKSLSPASIDQAIAVIRVRHRTTGHEGQPNTDAARRALRSHKRQRAEAGQRAHQAPPITLKLLRRMIESTDPSTVIGARDRLLLVLGFAMMARRSELAGLYLADVAETDDGLEVLIRASKTDQEARGRVVAIPSGTHPDTDPVRLYRAWCAVLTSHDITDGRLFRSVTRHGRIGQALSADAINDVVRTMAIRAELPNAENYTAHSLRAGGATSAYKSGAPVSVIASHGRWSPTSPVVLGYVRAVDRWKDNPMRGIGL